VAGLTKLDLSRQIANELFEKECLNLADYPSMDELIDEVSDTILNRLEDYTILRATEIL
jgi:hypothetical protein